jgi:hypothetical protein
MTTDQALEEMRHIADKHKHDPEAARRKADELLCKILRANGYYQTAEVFEKMKKHYAWPVTTTVASAGYNAIWEWAANKHQTANWRVSCEGASLPDDW